MFYVVHFYLDSIKEPLILPKKAYKNIIQTLNILYQSQFDTDHNKIKVSLMFAFLDRIFK